jgi:hypothetical protein
MLIRLSVRYLELVRIFYISSQKRQPEKFKTNSACTENTDLVFQTVKKIIHLMTQSLQTWRF